MKIEIKNRSGSKVLFSFESQDNSLKLTLEVAIKTGANLSGADLSGANLSGANLSCANLFWANLSGANLSGAYLSGAYLRDADLSGANLTDADFRKTKSQKSHEKALLPKPEIAAHELLAVQPEQKQDPAAIYHSDTQNWTINKLPIGEGNVLLYAAPQLEKPNKDTEQQTADTTNYDIVFDLATHRVFCTHCQASELITPFPASIPANRIVQWLNQFSVSHLSCLNFKEEN